MTSTQMFIFNISFAKQTCHSFILTKVDTQMENKVYTSPDLLKIKKLATTKKFLTSSQYISKIE